MFGMWDVWNVGCWECDVWDIRFRNAGCVMVAGVWDVALQNALNKKCSVKKVFSKS